MEKRKKGRPASEETKQINVRVKLSTLENPIIVNELEFNSFSQFVNKLIKNHLKNLS